MTIGWPAIHGRVAEINDDDVLQLPLHNVLRRRDVAIYTTGVNECLLYMHKNPKDRTHGHRLNDETIIDIIRYHSAPAPDSFCEPRDLRLTVKHF